MLELIFVRKTVTIEYFMGSLFITRKTYYLRVVETPWSLEIEEISSTEVVVI